MNQTSTSKTTQPTSSSIASLAPNEPKYARKRKPQILKRIDKTQYDIDNSRPRHPAGRKSRLTPKIQQKFLNMLNEGYPFPFIKLHLGLNNGLFEYYEMQARKGRNKEYAAFFEKLRELQAKQILPKWKTVENLGHGNSLKAAKYGLEVLAPEVFGEKRAESQAPSQHLHLHMSQDELNAKVKSIREVNDNLYNAPYTSPEQEIPADPPQKPPEDETPNEDNNNEEN